jgi:hypothetical protein
MIISTELAQQKYESLIGMIRYCELCSQDLDLICKYAVRRPTIEKEFFDFFERQRQMKNLDSHNCCRCVDQIVFRITQVIKEEFILK